MSLTSRLLVAVALLAVLASSVVSAASQTISLAAGDQLTVTCPTELRTTTATTTQIDVLCITAATTEPTATAAPTATSAPTSTPTNTPLPPTATPIPTATSAPAPAPSGSGIWLSASEIAALPMSGSGWTAVKAAADGSWGSPNLSDLNSNHDVLTLAGALVYVRTGQATYRSKVADAIMSAIGTESSSRALEISRNIQSYVIAADLIDFKAFDPTRESKFRSWLSNVRFVQFDGMSIIQSHERRPNNWGTHAGAARVIIDRYLGDTADLARAAQVWKGWMGDRASYAGFSYGDLSWQCNSAAPVGVNPKGCVKSGLSIDGVLPDDQRRAGGFTTSPPNENYVWEAMQGATVAAWVLNRAGYPAFTWQDQALKRAVTWEYQINGFPPTGDDTWVPYVINKAYGTSFATTSAKPGKNMGWTDWTHAK